MMAPFRCRLTGAARATLRYRACGCCASILCSVPISAAYSVSSMPSNIVSKASCMAGQARLNSARPSSVRKTLRTRLSVSPVSRRTRPCGFQRVERARQGRLLDDRKDGEVADRDAVGDRQHGKRAHLRDGPVLAAEILAQRGVVAAHDAVHQIGRELLQADLPEGRDALAFFGNLLVHHSALRQKEAGAAAEPCARMGRCADMVEALDRRGVVDAALERPPQEGLVDGRRAAIGIAADQVDVHRLEIGRRIGAARRARSPRSRRCAWRGSPRHGRHRPRAVPRSTCRRPAPPACRPHRP